MGLRAGVLGGRPQRQNGARLDEQGQLVQGGVGLHSAAALVKGAGPEIVPAAARGQVDGAGFGHALQGLGVHVVVHGLGDGAHQQARAKEELAILLQAGGVVGEGQAQGR